MNRTRTIGATASLLGFPAPAWAQARPWEAWEMHPMMWGMWGIWMMLVMLVFWGLVIASLALGVRWLVARGRAGSGDAAFDILRQRYARGEIDREEFLARRRDL